MKDDELHDRLMEIRGVVLTVEAEEAIDELVAALEANPPLVEVEARALKEVCVDRQPQYRLSLREITIPSQYAEPAQLDVTVTIRGR